MIVAERLTKDYGTVVAVRDVSFRVETGEVVGFLGPNGAGKTTALRMLAGSLGPTSGKVSIAGFDVSESPLEARRRTGYMPEAAPLYPEMRVREYLEFRARLKGLRRDDFRAGVDQAARRARVDDMFETVIGHLSKGYRQRVALADALLGNPPVLILDEPTAGLDPNQIHDVRELIRDLRGRQTILLSTHILSEVEASCDRVLVMHRGQLVAEGTLDEIRRRRSRASRVRLVVRGERSEIHRLLSSRDEANELEVRPLAEEASGGFECLITLGDDAGAGEFIEAMVPALAAAGLGVREAAPVQAALDDVFRTLTTKSEPTTSGASSSTPSSKPVPPSPKRRSSRKEAS